MIAHTIYQRINRGIYMEKEIEKYVEKISAEWKEPTAEEELKYYVSRDKWKEPKMK